MHSTKYLRGCLLTPYEMQKLDTLNRSFSWSSREDGQRPARRPFFVVLGSLESDVCLLVTVRVARRMLYPAGGFGVHVEVEVKGKGQE
jgi:hypothetical protein